MTDVGMVRPGVGFLILAAGVALFGLTQQYLGAQPRFSAGPELKTTLPLPAQILFAGGDRRLAANILGFRVLVADTAKMSRDDYAVQARLQTDLAWLNPSHEDNYYIAANILPWGGEVDAAEQVLRRAGDARKKDWLPFFHVGFIYYHFRHQPAQGVPWLLQAADRADVVQDKYGLQNIAAKWTEKGYDLTTAAQLVGAMASSAPKGGFQSYLQMRSERLVILAQLRKAAEAYLRDRKRPPESFRDLVRSGYLAHEPRDPLGLGFRLTKDGEVAFEKG